MSLARRQPKTGAWPGVFDESIASGLIGPLLAAINAQLTAMRADGTYDTLYKKYFG